MKCFRGEITEINDAGIDQMKRKTKNTVGVQKGQSYHFSYVGWLFFFCCAI